MEKEWMESIVKKHEREKKVSRIISMNCELAVPKGDNYCSEIWRAKLDVVLGSGQKTTRSVIVKKLPELEAHRQYIVHHGVFKREIGMYTSTIKRLESLMEEYKDQDEKLWCELIGYNCYDLVVLEDLRELNYRVADRREMLDLEHTMIAIKSLAKYHALTKALLKEGFQTQKDFRPLFFFDDPTTIKMVVINSLEVLADVIKTDWGPEWATFSERLVALTDTATEQILELGKVDDTRFNVINHGDCWTNNMMFKYNGQNKPVGMKFVDFQLSHFNSFAFDVVYFLYLSVKPEIRRGHIDEITEAYHVALIEKLSLYNIPQEELPSLESIKSEMKRLDVFGFYLLCSMFAIMTADGGDALDMEKALENPSESKNGINLGIFKCSRYKQIMQKELIEFSNSGVI